MTFVLTQPAVHNVGVDAVGHCDRSNGRFVLATLLDNLGFEFWAVVTPLGARGIALVRHSVHDLHSGHYRFDLTSVQYGVTGRLRSLGLNAQMKTAHIVSRFL